MQLLNVLNALHAICQQIKAATNTGAAAVDDDDAAAASSGTPEPEPDDDPLRDVDETALKQLEDMGFPRQRAGKALVLNNMQVQTAMDWLFMHADDADIDEPLVPPPREQNVSPGKASTSLRILSLPCAASGFIRPSTCCVPARVCS